jgi:hypothetical protein
VSRTVYPRYAEIGNVKIKVRKVILDVSGKTVERAMIYTSKDLPVSSASHKDVVLYLTGGRLTLEDYAVQSMGKAGVLEATRTDLSDRSALFEDVDPYEDFEEIEKSKQDAEDEDDAENEDSGYSRSESSESDGAPSDDDDDDEDDEHLITL